MEANKRLFQGLKVHLKFQTENNKFEEIAAGVPTMVSPIYSVPRQEGSKNINFRHPSLVSNVVFYSSNMNSKKKAKDQYVTTSSQMQSQGERSTSPYDLSQRAFMVNGNVAERLTRFNTSNYKNNSSFQLSYSKKELDASADSRNQRDKSVVKEVTNIPQTSVNIWRYKSSPF